MDGLCYSTDASEDVSPENSHITWCYSYNLATGCRFPGLRHFLWESLCCTFSTLDGGFGSSAYYHYVDIRSNGEPGLRVAYSLQLYRGQLLFVSLALSAVETVLWNSAFVII